ncbi:MAG: AmmeMemoRadiSam system protein A [Candidatus Woesebacteria bacterium]|jgi:AmmeMemoRadiSam system protein A
MKDQENNYNSGKILQLARKTLEIYLQTKKIPNLTADQLVDESLNQTAGVFVTLKKNGQLRGCIGLIESAEPLWRTIPRMSIDAAINDPRFDPVSFSELEDIKIEVSILSSPKKVNSVNEITVGKHGVILSSRGRKGVFLPSVATEFNWTKKELLENLCLHKAHLPANCWQDPGVQLYTFISTVFKEE